MLNIDENEILERARYEFHKYRTRHRRMIVYISLATLPQFAFSLPATLWAI
ncbi:MAG TPA: hypothetical protein VNF46_06150 [Gammaproteobacteria bacterium]|nr:hypothetical protein [Gammaproteobacteria bacterium]